LILSAGFLLTPFLFTACGVAATIPINPATEAIQTNIESAPVTVVGSSVEVVMTVTNVGTADIAQLAVRGLLKTWLQHNQLTAVDPPACRQRSYSGQPELLCGPLAAGHSIEIDITGQALEAGSFTYLVTFDDASHGFTLQETDGKAYSYSIGESVAQAPN
jgi:hypothetical protein